MIDVLSLKKGDRFWECCAYHWRVRLEFIELEAYEDLNIIIAKYVDDFGVFKKDEICEICNLKECFKTEELAIEYQNQCRNDVKKLPKDELLKILLNKCHSMLTDEEYKLYKEIIYCE